MNPIHLFVVFVALCCLKLYFYLSKRINSRTIGRQTPLEK